MNTITIKQERLLELICEVLYEEGELGQEAEFPEEMIDSAANELLDDLSTLEEQEESEGFHIKILNSLKSLFSKNKIDNKDKEEFAELTLYKAQQTAKRARQIKIAALLGALLASSGSILNNLQNEARQERLSGYHNVGVAQDYAKSQIRGGYEGPPLSKQDDYYRKIDFTGQIGYLGDLPNSSIAKRISNGKRAPSDYYINPVALLDKPIPKLKSTTGQKALDYYNHIFESHDDKVSYLLLVYNNDFAGIGQVGLAGAESVLIPVKEKDNFVKVQPPEFSIVLYFLTEAVKSLTEEEQNEFFSEVESEEVRKYYMTQPGMYSAIRYGHQLGIEGDEIDKDSYEYKYARSLVELGYEAGKDGKSMPPVPSRGR